MSFADRPAWNALLPPMLTRPPRVYVVTRRLFYVAMTRAQALLHITHADKRMERGMFDIRP